MNVLANLCWLIAAAFLLLFTIWIVVTGMEARKVAAMTPPERERYRLAQKEALSAHLDRRHKAKRESLVEKQEALQNAKLRQHEAALDALHGQLNAAMICPHCHAKGRIRTQIVDRKKGVSGGKATAALLTAGISMLATGLSRMERLTQAYCANGNNSWQF
jgi:hypothetical protein